MNSKGLSMRFLQETMLTVGMVMLCHIAIDSMTVPSAIAFAPISTIGNSVAPNAAISLSSFSTDNIVFKRSTTCLRSQQQPEEDSSSPQVNVMEPQDNFDQLDIIDDEAPAGIVGAEFFGGNKQKEEFYDEREERTAAATATIDLADISQQFDRFNHREAFDTDAVASVASSLQRQINDVLYDEDNIGDEEYRYTNSNFDWTSPLVVQSSNTNPMEELKTSNSFYKHLDVAIISGQQVSETVFELQWEISAAWPTFWEPRALLLGSSTVTLDGNNIVGQFDKVVDNGGDLTGTLAQQILPRFWDMYHIGMTPSAELHPKINRKEPSLFGNFQVYDVPSRWMVQPTRLETGSRDDFNAQLIPNHAFSSIIKTMGPTRQRYVPTNGVETQILATSPQKTLSWKIPISVEFQSQLQWPRASADEEAEPNSQPECEYTFVPRRRVATIPFAGEAQDAEISQIRKQLYEQVLKSGGDLKPKLDENGRPIFFFLSGTTKACYTRTGGLGMSVYEYRPQWAKANEVGMELELLGEVDGLLSSPLSTNALNGSD